MEQNKKYRNYCWTDFILDEGFYEKMRDSKKWKYIIRGTETCPETKKTHFQCFGVCNSPRTMKSLMKELAPRHVEICRGSLEDNINYCSKEGKIWKTGIAPMKQGKRSDIDLVRDELQDGANMRKIVDVATSYQSVRVAEKWLEYKETKRTWKPKVIWYWGDTGSGKTRTAVDECIKDVGDDGFWMSDNSLRWWQGYDGHSHVIFDDFRGDACKFHELLRILDRYPYRIECKGSARQLLATHIYITCPVKPEDVYRRTSEDIQQLLRRIDEVRYFGTKVNGTKVGGNTSPRPFDLEDFLTTSLVDSSRNRS